MGRPGFVSEETGVPVGGPEAKPGVRDEDRGAVEPTSGEEHKPQRVRLPGLVTDEVIGLGDVIKRVTSAFGVRPCAGCERRAEVLNRWLSFTGRRRR